VPGTGFGRQWLQDVLYGNRHYSAEIALDGVLQLCATRDPNVTVGGQTTDVAQACAVLADLGPSQLNTSVGTHVWTELWRRLSGAPTPGSGLPRSRKRALRRALRPGRPGEHAARPQRRERQRPRA
jgi:acyl-homoserine-lactone acylase